MNKKISSKLDNFPEYMNEYRCNSEYLKLSLSIYLNLARNTLSNENILEDKCSFEKFYISYRIKDILVSVTDDLIRYATYHKIGTDVRRNGDKIFSISEPTRATFFTKWILKLRPLIIDNIIPLDHVYIGSEEEDISFSGRDIHKIEFCNEHLALIAASFILNIRYEDVDEIVTYEKLFHNSELSTLFYSLRYRTVHQDSYGFLYRKIFNFYESNSIRKN